jgi:hypothetical protein
MWEVQNSVDQFYGVYSIRRQSGGREAVPPLSEGTAGKKIVSDRSIVIDSSIRPPKRRWSRSRASAMPTGRRRNVGNDRSIAVEAKRSFPFQPVLALGVTAAAASFIAFLVARYGVAIPMLDDWEMAPLVAKAHLGGLTFHDLFEQQQEARTFFPKLLFIALSFGKQWDGRVEMMLSILICCLTALGIYRLLAKSKLSLGATTIAFLFIVLLIFSPAQHELWLLASGFPSFVPALCVVWGICIVVGGRFSIATKFWLCAGLAFFASFTLASGLLVWGVTFPFLLATQREPRWKRWLGFWFLATTACAAIYFWNFHAQPDLPTFAPRKSIVDYWCYLTAFLGSGLGRSGNDNPLGVSISVGTVLLIGYFASFGHFLFRFRDPEYRGRVAPWLALGAYSIASGTLAALGRIEWGVAQALESRYVAFSLYVPVAMVGLGAIFAGEFSKARGQGKRPRWIFATAVFLGASFLTLELLCGVGSVPFFRVRSAAARLGQSGILFSQVMDTSSTTKGCNYPRPSFTRENAAALDRLHLFRPPLIRTREISQLRHADVGEGMASGWWDGLTSGDNKARTAWGWAALPSKNRPADAVILAYANARGEWIAFALSEAVINRPDVAKVLRSGEQLWSGWRAVFSPDVLPQGAEISAWAVDAKDAKLYRLKTQERVFNR